MIAALGRAEPVTCVYYVSARRLAEVRICMIGFLLIRQAGLGRHAAAGVFLPALVISGQGGTVGVGTDGRTCCARCAG
jgi:hypothetical protein